MKKIFAGIVLASFLFFLGTPATAAGLTQAQINAIISLLQSFGANSSVINNVRVSLSGGMPIISEGGNNGSNPIQPTLTCARFSHNLYLGQSDKETGNEVSKLQKFLKDLGHFTYPTITGYYGPATEQAVQKFQVSQGVVSSGSYETTGYGVVGPKTQEKIVSISCGNQTTTTPSPSTPGSTQTTLPQQTQNTVPSGSGGGGGGAGSGPRLGVPFKCSDYQSYFASIPSCESIGKAYQDGVEVESSFYKLCKQCLSVGSISPPLISNIQTVDLTENSATITWVTNELADSEIIYTTSSQSLATLSPPVAKIVDSASTINHSLNLSNLTKNTVYYYKVVSVRVNGYPAESSEQSFTILSN